MDDIRFGASAHPPHRPHNSLYVVSDRGELVTRYDERLLSNTKISFMYSPGKIPVTFEVDGVRFGCALGMEAHYPEIFIEYERLDVDCVLFSTTGELLYSAPRLRCRGTGTCGKQYILGQLLRPRAAKRHSPLGNSRAGRSMGGAMLRGWHTRHRGRKHHDRSGTSCAAVEAKGSVRSLQSASGEQRSKERGSQYILSSARP